VKPFSWEYPVNKKSRKKIRKKDIYGAKKMERRLFINISPNTGWL